MRRFIMIMITLFTLVFVSTNACAQKSNKMTPTNMVEQKLTLYAQPTEKSKVVGHIDQWHRLVPIYRKNDWIKVGNQEDGTVGWINMQQYHTFMKSWFHPHIKSVMITIEEQPDKNGKTEIIAYQNGKQLDEQETQKLLKRFQKNQQMMEKRYQMMHKEMEEMFDTTWKMWEMDDFMRTKMHTFHRMLLSSPIIVMMTQPDENDDNEKNEK